MPIKEIRQCLYDEIAALLAALLHQEVLPLLFRSEPGKLETG
jgi:hypothetical protein